MPVTIQDVEHVARLARLSFADAEKATLTAQLNQILAYMEQLDGLDTSAVEPLSQVIDLRNVFREDLHRPGVTAEEALRNAPARAGDLFRVPKAMGDR